jgi:hypothetical protein
MDTVNNQQPNVVPSQAQQGGQIQQPVMFYPDKVYRSYTSSQWQLKEDWYVNKVQSINIPLSPSPADLANTANDIETALSTARLDMAFIKQGYDKFSMLYKIQEKIVYTDLQNYNIVNPGAKLTVPEKESYVAKIMKNTPWNNGKLTLFDLLQESTNRYTFMDGVIKTLCDKKDLLITHSSVIKAEASLNGFSNNAPNIPQNYGGN